MKLNKLLLIVSLLGLSFSCSKQSEPQPLTRTQLLVDKKWQLRSAVLTSPGSADFDAYVLTPSCRKDDYWQFTSPDKWVTDEGATKCAAIYPQQQLGTWALSINDTKLTLIDQNFTDTYTIIKLTSDSLKMSVTIPQSTGINALSTVIYTTIK